MLQRRTLWLFLAPSFLILTCVLLWPLSYAIYLSLFNYTLTSAVHTFIGFGNYAALLSEQRFWASIATTFTIAGWALAVELALGFFLAMCLYKLKYGARAFIVALFLPAIITPVVAALFLKWLFVADWGLIDNTLLSFGINTPNWLGTAFWAKVVVVVGDAWIATPFVMLVLFAALQQLDSSQLEAATLDGAGTLQLVRFVILPAIAPTVVFVVCIRLMDVFRNFDTIYILTAGGPGTATETITMYTYRWPSG
jgi:multiple sugar transport system permease protein